MKAPPVINSLAFRIALVLFFTLSAAQAVNFYVFTEQRRNDLIQEASYNAIQRFVERVREPSQIRFETGRAGRPDGPRSGLRNRPRPINRGVSEFEHRPRRNRPPPGDRPINAGGRLHRRAEPLIIYENSSLNPDLSEQLKVALLENSINVEDARASYAPAPERPRPPRGQMPPRGDRKLESNDSDRPFEIRFTVKLQGSQEWINGIYPVKPLPESLSLSDFLESASIFVFFLILAITLIAYNIVRPIRALSKATLKVGQHREKVNLSVKGPNEIRQMTEAFNQMNERVNELLREKDVLLGALGHDLRTPLTSLRLRIEQMAPIETREQAITTIDETAKLIDDILEFARSVGDIEALTKYDLTSIIYDTVADYQDMNADVSFVDSGRIVMPCKPSAIKRMLRDLIENALKYGGNATISVSSDERQVTLLVEDDGPGVDDAAIESLLQPFKRGEDSRSRRTGGTGLGLAIAKSVATAHGGDLALMNRPSGGLCVRVLLSL